MKLRHLIYVSIILVSFQARSAVTLIDASLGETLSSFSVLTGVIYVTDINTDDKFNVRIEETLDAKLAEQKLADMLASSGLTILKINDKQSKVIRASDTSSTHDSEQITQRISLPNGVSQRAIEQVIQFDSKFKGVRAIASGLDDSSLIVVAQPAQIDDLVNLINSIKSKHAQPSSPQKQFNAPEVKAPENQIVDESGSIVIDLKFADSSAVGQTLEKLIGTENQRIRYAIHQEANQIILAGFKSEIKHAENIIYAMDRKPRQVYVDAIIAEVSDAASSKIGAQLSGTTGKTGMAFADGTNTGSIGNIAASQTLQAVTGGLLTIGPGSSLIPDLGVVLAALEEDGDTKILATPSLMTTENKESQILVGQNVPFVTGQYVNNTTSSTPFQTIERRDLGTMLKIKPRIGRDGQIILDIKQEVSRIDSTTSNLSDVATIKREISTTINIESGETIAIGGLKDTQEESSESRVPVLGAIPVLGNLFKKETKRSVNRNLIVFLKPTIVTERAARNTVRLEAVESVAPALNLDIAKEYNESLKQTD